MDNPDDQTTLKEIHDTHDLLKEVDRSLKEGEELQREHERELEELGLDLESVRLDNCSHCGYSPIAMGAWSCPKCGGRSPHPANQAEVALRRQIYLDSVLGVCSYHKCNWLHKKLDPFVEVEHNPVNSEMYLPTPDSEPICRNCGMTEDQVVEQEKKDDFQGCMFDWLRILLCVGFILAVIVFILLVK